MRAIYASTHAHPRRSRLAAPRGLVTPSFRIKFITSNRTPPPSTYIYALKTMNRTLLQPTRPTGRPPLRAARTSSRRSIAAAPPAQHHRPLLLASRSTSSTRAAAQQQPSSGEATSTAAAAPAAASALASRRCEPCEAARDAEAAMGLQAAFDPQTAGRYLAHLQPGWRVVEDAEGRLRVRRRYRTKNFVKVSRCTNSLDSFARCANSLMPCIHPPPPPPGPGAVPAHRRRGGGRGAPPRPGAGGGGVGLGGLDASNASRWRGGGVTYRPTGLLIDCLRPSTTCAHRPTRRPRAGTT
jgi:hypothetical protein